jgi:hypothetical protein
VTDISATTDDQQHRRLPGSGVACERWGCTHVNGQPELLERARSARHVAGGGDDNGHRTDEPLEGRNHGVIDQVSGVDRPGDAAGISGGRRDDTPPAEPPGGVRAGTAVALAGPGPAGLTVATELADLGERARAYAEAARADSTWRAYRSDLRQVTRWCAPAWALRCPG